MSMAFDCDGIDIFIVAEQILELFQMQDVTEPRAEDSNPEKPADRLKEVQQYSILRKPEPIREDDGEDVTRMGENYRRYRTAEELPKEARAFYEVAGGFQIFSEGIGIADLSLAKNVGVDITKLVRAVFRTEIQLDNWSLAETKRRLIEKMHNLDLRDF
jgi:RNA polymerase I-specific transcription initiation factor RRN7